MDNLTSTMDRLFTANDTVDGDTSVAGMASDVNETAMEMCSSLFERNGTTTYAIFSLVVPSNAAHWEERTTAYWFFFYTMVVIFSILYLSLALGCVILLAKRHLAQRFKVRTFIAIDIALMVLGFSRVLFFILDPWGQSDFCRHYACIVISRLIGALAFPSLTASYTLVLITLWISTRMQLGLSCIQHLKVLVPLCFIHYGVAIGFEIMGSIPTKSSNIIVMLLLLCETTFSLWGFLVCTSFLITGHRLLKRVEKSVRSSSMICRDSPHVTRQQLMEGTKLPNQALTGKKGGRSKPKLKHLLKDHHKRALRKVTLITYITVLLGMTYSVVNFVNLILACLSFFFGCPGYLGDNQSKQHPGVWLMLRYTSFTLELFLAVLLTYSISDYRPILNLLCCKMGKDSSIQDSQSGVESCTIDSEGPSKAFTNGRDISPTSDSKSKEEDFSASSSCSSLQPLKSPVRSNSLPLQSSKTKRVTIMENNSSTQAGKAGANHFSPKVTSPLAVSQSRNNNST